MTYSINSPEMQLLRKTLKDARLKRQLTMRALSVQLKKPHSYVQKVEEGERRLDVVEFVWYCKALKLDPVPVVTALVLLASQLITIVE